MPGSFHAGIEEQSRRVRLGCRIADRWSYFGLLLSAPSPAFMQKLLI